MSIKLLSANATFQNFHRDTTATFTKCETPNREPDFESHSGSKYWYEGDSVIRESNHWGSDIASCNWYMKNYKKDHCSNWRKGTMTGICKLVEFKHVYIKKVEILVNGSLYLDNKDSVYLDKAFCKRNGLKTKRVRTVYHSYFAGKTLSMEEVKKNKKKFVKRLEV